eukprot:41151-Chlamydomonas_euryale.AAC.1
MQCVQQCKDAVCPTLHGCSVPKNEPYHWSPESQCLLMRVLCAIRERERESARAMCFATHRNVDVHQGVAVVCLERSTHEVVCQQQVRQPGPVVELWRPRTDKKRDLR